METSLLITLFLGAQLTGLSDALLPPWLAAFAEYPLLVKGNIEGGENYLQIFSKEEQSAVAMATIDDKLAGFLVGLPLDKYPFSTELHDFNDVDQPFYYLSDSVVLPAYRKQGIVEKLFHSLLEKVQSWNYKKMCIATVVREEDHPLKPEGYSHDLIWQQLGFEKTSVQVKALWPTIVDQQGSVEERENTLEVLVRELT